MRDMTLLWTIDMILSPNAPSAFPLLHCRPGVTLADVRFVVLSNPMQRRIFCKRVESS